MLYRCSIDSPVGCLRLEEEDGYLTGLHFDPDPSVRYADDTDLLRQTEQQLTEYFAGSRTSFSIPLKLQGTDFQKRVWKVLQTIPYAKTMSYGQVAALAGNPKACRAVGMANNRNPVAIIVPCHRVIGANGGMVGYGGGLWVKEKLLRLEQDVLNRTQEG